MVTNRRNKRVRRSRLGKPVRLKPNSIGGRFLAGFWAVTLVLTGTTILLFRYQLDRKGHADIPLALIVLLACLVIIAFAFTIQWFRARHNVVR